MKELDTALKLNMRKIEGSKTEIESSVETDIKQPHGNAKREYKKA